MPLPLTHTGLSRGAQRQLGASARPLPLTRTGLSSLHYRPHEHQSRPRDCTWVCSIGCMETRMRDPTDQTLIGLL